MRREFSAGFRSIHDSLVDVKRVGIASGQTSEPMPGQTFADSFLGNLKEARCDDVYRQAAAGSHEGMSSLLSLQLTLLMVFRRKKLPS